MITFKQSFGYQTANITLYRLPDGETSKVRLCVGLEKKSTLDIIVSIIQQLSNDLNQAAIKYEETVRNNWETLETLLNPKTLEPLLNPEILKSLLNRTKDVLFYNALKDTVKSIEKKYLDKDVLTV